MNGGATRTVSAVNREGETDEMDDLGDLDGGGLDGANGRHGRGNGHKPLKRPPPMGEMKRQADAQALTLRPELRAVMQVRGLSEEDVAREAKLDLESVRLFLGGASLNPRWQEKLAKWLARALGE